MQKIAILIRGKDPDVEEILSEDDIYLNQLIEPNDLKNEHDNINNVNDEISLLQDQIEPIDIDYVPIIIDDEPTERIQQQEPDPFNNDLLNENELIVNNHYMVDNVNDEEEQVPTKPRISKHQTRSAEA